jgi:hypothetical protein
MAQTAGRGAMFPGFIRQPTAIKFRISGRCDRLIVADVDSSQLLS